MVGVGFLVGVSSARVAAAGVAASEVAAGGED